MKNFSKIVLSAVGLSLIMGVLGCAHMAETQPQQDTQAELLAADSAYEAYNRKYGFKAASAEFISFDRAFMIEAGEGFLTTEDEILAARDLTTVPSPVKWQAVGAMAGSDDFGITWGKFSVDDAPTAGNYVTVWQRIDGEWKIITDVAVNDPVGEYATE